MLLGADFASLALAGGAAPADGVRAAPWRIGAVVVDTTPPPCDATQDLVDFPEVDPARDVISPRSAYDGPRC